MGEISQKYRVARQRSTAVVVAGWAKLDRAVGRYGVAVVAVGLVMVMVCSEVRLGNTR